MIDTIYPEGVQNSSWQPAYNGHFPDVLGAQKAHLTSKLDDAVCDENSCPVELLLAEMELSDYIGTRRLLPSLPKAAESDCQPSLRRRLVSGRGEEQRSHPCIPSLKAAEKAMLQQTPL
ncbi:MAG: hypothetical protein JNK03_07090 [Nitrospira sp.]|nr:hypothetical protein [Nitrospira sp.]